MKGIGEEPNPFFLMRAAKLSDAKKATVKTIVQTNRQNGQPIISQLLSLRQQFNSALFTTGAADSDLLAQINALQGQLQQSRLAVFQQVWSQVLNPTQESQVGAAFAQSQANRAQPHCHWWSFKQSQNQ